MAVTDEAILQIKQMILDGRLRPGDRLPPEQELSASLGLSRSSLREAVKALEIIRVLDVRRGDGTYVTSLEPGLLLEAMSFVVDLHEDASVLELFAVRRILERQHEVTVFHEGSEALAALDRGERYDLLLCDLMMPEMTGMDFYEALQQRWPEQAERLVFLTGGAFTIKAREFLDRVSCPRFEKPFSARTLRALVNDYLKAQSPTLLW